MKLLHIDSSINGASSVSRKLSADIVSQWTRDHPDTVVDYLDLAVQTPAHLSQDALGFRRPPHDAALTEAEQIENRLSEALVSQFLAADVVVIGAPLYNFSIPSQLKSWIDRIAQGGRTFKYTENGVVGLAAGKIVIAALSRGGVYSTTEAGQAMEHQESYLKAVFGFFGITDLRFVRAEGTDMGADSRSQALQIAADSIRTLVVRQLQPA
jgi:FMN-dependent NADH-azoreductase